MTTDRIEKRILLRASRERVWSAIADSAQFGRWFGVAFEGPFVEGQRVGGRIVPTTVDDEVAGYQKPYAGLACDFLVERIEPMRRFAFRWHLGAAEPEGGYASEPMTLVEFELTDAEGGILLVISESGFDQIPLARRAQAFADNEGGWEMQTRLIAKYLALAVPE